MPPKKNDLEKRQQDFNIEIKKIDEDSKEIEAVVSTEDIDRYGDIIIQDGWDFSDFEKNPVIFADHRYSVEKIVGKAVDWRVENQKLYMTIKFNTDFQLGADVFSMFKNGFLNAFSVGFVPIEAGYEQKEGKDIFVIRKAKLLEVSAVGIPANPNALQLAMRKGLISKESDAEIRKMLGAEFEVKEKQAELDLKIKVFAENHEVLKGYRELNKSLVKSLGITPEGDELAQIKQLNDTVIEILNVPSEEPVVKTSPQAEPKRDPLNGDAVRKHFKV